MVYLNHLRESGSDASEVGAKYKSCTICDSDFQEDANHENKTKQNATVLLLIALAVGAWFLVPPSGSYRLKSGYAVCPTKEGVVAYRGARMFGPLATGLVIASKGCKLTSAPLRVLRRSTMFDLPYRVSISGRVMYADHDALEKV